MLAHGVDLLLEHACLKKIGDDDQGTEEDGSVPAAVAAEDVKDSSELEDEPADAGPAPETAILGLFWILLSLRLRLWLRLVRILVMVLVILWVGGGLGICCSLCWLCGLSGREWVGKLV